MSDQLESGIAIWSGTLNDIRLARAERLEASGSWTVGTLVQLGVGITQLNGNVSVPFLVMTDSVDS